MRRISVLLAIIASLVLVNTALAASAKPKLSFVKSGATIGWSSEGGSSPAGSVSNANTQSLRISVGASPAGASAYTYGANEDLVGIRGLALSEIDRLGFDSKGDLTGGAPRISLGTQGTDGQHTYFLSAFHCNKPLTGGWRTSDFVHDTVDCKVFRDGVEMTWAQAVAAADANNELVAPTPNDWFLIVDEQSLTYVDRLTVQDWCWTGNGTNGIVNENSGDCIDGP